MSDPIHDIAVEVAALEDFYDHFGFADAQAEPGGLAAEIVHMLHEAPQAVIKRMYDLFEDTGDYNAIHLAAMVRRTCVEAA
ncbi:Uncharacterised protein [Slackia heliotrinireducens]|uniref:Uncharacterized protein n=1 Tax=Slackia heliotrinireducens (strain ATCC 29202 / DSM 20476 / NCTC 11029 / RHS 1) TaxID=471855 RepID=C7N830_SLAHD|nr:hypothetical protein [Slackia heliotrinireducens]ACV23065.1 hypothetical protein Shel_20530 [Slackia heliotrinireducens DSM 20476]VEH02021.1 Uncharacterised protein [Slackia heliotrinireducens]